MTGLDYLGDSYRFSAEAEVLEVKETERGLAVILDRTIFYPQGGGQPADRGEIRAEGVRFLVSDVRLDENGVVFHYGEFVNGRFGIGKKVELEIEEERRILNARLHSGGHLVDLAAMKAGFGLKAVKGYHFLDGPYIEYEGVIENPMDFAGEIEKIANELVDSNLPLESHNYSAEEAVARGLKAPAGKSVRTVNFSGSAEVGCGGTHVRSSNEIGKIQIRKIVGKGGVTKIAYQI